MMNAIKENPTVRRRHNHPHSLCLYFLLYTIVLIENDEFYGKSHKNYNLCHNKFFFCTQMRVVYVRRELLVFSRFIGSWCHWVWAYNNYIHWSVLTFRLFISYNWWWLAKFIYLCARNVGHPLSDFFCTIYTKTRKTVNSHVYTRKL